MDENPKEKKLVQAVVNAIEKKSAECSELIISKINQGRYYEGHFVFCLPVPALGGVFHKKYYFCQPFSRGQGVYVMEGVVRRARQPQTYVRVINLQ